MVVVVARQVRLLVLLVIHRRIVGILQLNVARHVTVVILLVADAVAGHHLHLLMLVTLVAATTPTTGRRSATASATTAAATAGSVLILAIRRLILRPVFPVLLDPFVLCPPILEPNFDLDKGNKCLS